MASSLNNFRNLNVYPTSQEILNSRPGFVGNYIAQGRYDNVEHYLEILFRILKELFVAPLREDIAKYIELNDTILSFVEIYQDVVFQSTGISEDGNSAGMILKFSNQEVSNRIFSPISKVLTRESIVCFTKNQFSSVFFGDVAEKNCDKQRLLIRFEPNYINELIPPGNVAYTMVDCRTAFERYYYTLKALQSMSKDLPMASYLIDVNPRMERPDYLRENSSVFRIQGRNVDLFGNDWPSAEELAMDSTQYLAFKAALTQKFVMIQGHSGTGKTYLGLQIIKTLLDENNRKIWYRDTPILIICKTNDGLDHFLEGLIPTTDRIVRVGGQSKNGKIEQFYLINQCKNWIASRYILNKRRVVLALKNKIFNNLNALKVEDQSISQRNILEMQDVLEDLELSKDKKRKLETNLNNLLTMKRHDGEATVIVNSYKKILIELFEEVNKNYNEVRNMMHLEMMKSMLVVGMTTTAAARLQNTLQALKCPIVIVEEAAEISEAHLVVSLTPHCKHLILLGCHNHIRSTTADHHMKREVKLGVTMFERMILNNIPCNVLGVQYRMRSEISQLLVPRIWPGLENHHSVTEFPPILGVESPLYFIHHEHEEIEETNGKSNLHEAKYLINLASYLRQNGYKPEDITIIANTTRQKVVVYEESEKLDSPLEDVAIHLLDTIQRKESKIILLSLVSNRQISKLELFKLEELVSVAISRAREGLYIMGNMELLCENTEIWPKIRASLEQQNCIGKDLPVRCQVHRDHVALIRDPEDFEGIQRRGCNKRCVEDDTA